MFATVFLLASSLSGADKTMEKPAAPAAPPLVAVGRGIRIAIPPLGPAAPADKELQKQVFAFYLGLFH